MKLLFLSNLYPPNEIGGYEKLCYSIAQGMVDKGYEVVVLTSNYGEKKYNHKNQKVINELKLHINSENIYTPFLGSEEEKRLINERNINCYKKVIESEQPDLVFIWNLFFLDQSFLSVLCEDNIKKVFFLTDNWLLFFVNPEFIGSYMNQQTTKMRNQNIRHYMKKFIELFPSKKCNIFFQNFSAIFSSNYMLQLYKTAGIKFDESKLIYNGVELKKLRNIKKIDRSFFVSEERINLFFAGRIVDVKGLDVLLRSLNLLINEKRYTNIFLKVIGDNSDSVYMKKINDYIKNHKLERYVSFQKPVSEEKLLEEFQKNDIFIFPSLYEPFSLTLIYAQASGIPTIASKTGGNPEIIINGKTGMLYDKFNYKKLARIIIELINKPGLRNRISENAMENANKFGLDEMKDRIAEYLRR